MLGLLLGTNRTVLPPPASLFPTNQSQASLMLDHDLKTKRLIPFRFIGPEIFKSQFPIFLSENSAQRQKEQNCAGHSHENLLTVTCTVHTFYRACSERLREGCGLYNVEQGGQALFSSSTHTDPINDLPHPLAETPTSSTHSQIPITFISTVLKSSAGDFNTKLGLGPVWWIQSLSSTWTQMLSLSQILTTGPWIHLPPPAMFFICPLHIP